MTKQEALRGFRQHVVPMVHAQYGKHDKPAMREAWNDFTDMMCKDGTITQRQYNIWTNPF